MDAKNTARTLEAVARVCQKIMATLYDTYFPGAEVLRPGPISQCVLCMAFGTDRKG